MPLKQIPRKDVRAIIAKATNKKQDIRYQSASEFRVDVDKLPANLPLPNPILKWIAGSAGAVAIIALIAWILWPTNKLEDKVLLSPSYSEAVAMLKSGRAKEGLHFLDSLAEKNDYNATYLLSRLYFDPKYKKECDQIPDSIWPLQLSAGIKPDYEKANKLLMKAISINPQDYNALYALGCEYLIGDRLTLEGRNLHEAKEYLDKALKSAKDNKDQDFVQIVEELKEKYKSDLDKERR